jgi:hypothetical protein
MSKLFLLFCISLSLCLSGCGYFSGFADKSASGIPCADEISQAHPQAVSYIAAIAASHLAAVYPPGRTVLKIDGNKPFGQALENALRRRGFAVFDGGIPIGYTLDKLQDGACYLSIILPEGTLTQCFSLANGRVDVFPSFIKNGTYEYTQAPAPIFDNYLATAPVPARSKTLPAQAASSYAQVIPNQFGQNQGQAAQYGQAGQTGKAANSGYVPAPYNGVPGIIPISYSPDADADSAPVMVNPGYYMEPPVPAAPATPEWRLRPGFLREQLETWAKRAGFQLVWKAKHDFDIESGASFASDFVDALRDLALLLHEQGNPLRLNVYLGNRVAEFTEE